MFVKNRTSIPVALPRGSFLEGISVAAVVATIPFRRMGPALQHWDGPRQSMPTDPPSMTDKALWEGASLTVAGTVFGPGRVPHTAPVQLRVGEVARRLNVFGDRTWVRNAGRLIASLPAPWDSMPLCWERAFGGAFEVPAGPMGPKKLPHPGGRFVHALNPHGKGICLDENTAEGKALPNVESVHEPLKCPTDQPRPAGLAPCPDLFGLRLPEGLTEEQMKDPVQLLHLSLRMAHAAPGEQIFASLNSGAVVEVLGVGAGPIRFEVPSCPFQVSTRKGRSLTTIATSVRCVHVSADDAAVLVTYGAPFAYETPPSWVEVTVA